MHQWSIQKSLIFLIIIKWDNLNKFFPDFPLSHPLHFLLSPLRRTYITVKHRCYTLDFPNMLSVLPVTLTPDDRSWHGMNSWRGYVFFQLLLGNTRYKRTEPCSQVRGAAPAQWWEHSFSTVAQDRFPDSSPYVGWVCWFSTLLREVFPGYSSFPLSSKTNICRRSSVG